MHSNALCAIRVAFFQTITDTLKVLDQRKYDAIELTFRQVSKEFRSVFQKLVRGGRGSIVMRVGQVGHRACASWFNKTLETYFAIVPLLIIPKIRALGIQQMQSASE